MAGAKFGGDRLALDNGGARVFVEHLGDVCNGFLHAFLGFVSFLVVIGPPGDEMFVVLHGQVVVGSRIIQSDEGRQGVSSVIGGHELQRGEKFGGGEGRGRNIQRWRRRRCNSE